MELTQQASKVKKRLHRDQRRLGLPISGVYIRMLGDLGTNTPLRLKEKYHNIRRDSHQTASTNSTTLVFSSTPLNTVSGDRERRVSSAFHDLIRRRMRTLDPTAAAKKQTITRINPTPSKSPSTKQSSVRSRCDGRNPCSSEGLSCACPLWLTTASLFRSLQSCVLDRPGTSSGLVGSMILSKSSLHTVCARRSRLEGFGSLRYVSSMSGVNLATHCRWGSGMLLNVMRGTD